MHFGSSSMLSRHLISLNKRRYAHVSSQLQNKISSHKLIAVNCTSNNNFELSGHVFVFENGHEGTTSQ